MCSTFNLPDGATADQIDSYYGEAMCLDCAHFVESSYDNMGVCTVKMDEAFEAKCPTKPLSPWEAAVWAAGWTIDNLQDEARSACMCFES